jgi:hypothetical protein
LERHTALTQIGLIGGYRLADVVASLAGVEIKAMSDRLPPTVRDAGFTQAGAAAASLLREWMLAANLDLYTCLDGSLAGILAGIQQRDPHATYLLTGAYTDPTTGSLRRDRGLGSLTGIVVAQHLRQKNLALRFNLCVLATSGAPDSDPLAPLRSAGLNPRYEVYAREPTAAADRPDELPDTSTLERAARALENFLITQPSKIQE